LLIEEGLFIEFEISFCGYISEKIDDNDEINALNVKGF
jgi:hypothetical protein